MASETRSVSKFIDKMKTKAGKLEQIIVEEDEVVKAQGKALESVEVSEARFQQKHCKHQIEPDTAGLQFYTQLLINRSNTLS